MSKYTLLSVVLCCATSAAVAASSLSQDDVYAKAFEKLSISGVNEILKREPVDNKSVARSDREGMPPLYYAPKTTNFDLIDLGAEESAFFTVTATELDAILDISSHPSSKGWIIY